MIIEEGKLYFIKDEFLKKYGEKYNLMNNKLEKGIKRPTYFCFRDNKEENILWFVPIEEYLRGGRQIKIPKTIEQEILGKSKKVISLASRGIVATYTNLPEFIKEIKQEINRLRTILYHGN